MNTTKEWDTVSKENDVKSKDNDVMSEKGDTGSKFSILLPGMDETVLQLFDQVIAEFQKLPNADLTDVERRRLMSSGTRRYGFLDATSDLAEANPQYYPLNVNSVEMKEAIRDIEYLRNLLGKIRELDRIVSNSLFVRGDTAFRMSLSFYNYVHWLAKTGDSGARAIFNVLKPFFHRPRRKTGEPTAKQVLRDVKAGLRGKKDVDIHIEHESPHIVGGVHLVSDASRKRKGGFKATERGEVE